MRGTNLSIHRIMKSLSWIFLEEIAISDYLANDQLNLLSTYKTQEPSSLLKNIIKDICTLIQSRIPEKLHPCPMTTNQLPSACKTAACHLVIEALQTRIPELQLSEGQIRNAQQARTTLEDLYKYWADQTKPSTFQPHIEAVRYRIRESSNTTLKGL